MICDICGKEFTSTLANLRRHRKYKHNIVDNVEYNIKCMEPSCIFSCSKLENLRQHLEETHEILQEVDELLFESIEEFHKWKVEEETRCVAVWVKRHGKVRQKDPTLYYYCNRSGKRRLLAAEQRKRKVKKQGSCKIDFCCTSAIIVKILPGLIKVKYYKNHYGHENELDYVPLSDDAKSMIAAQLMQGITPSEIISKIRGDTDTNFERLSLISKKDIFNIIREYNLYDLETDRVTCKISRIITGHEAAENAKNTLVIKFDDGWRVFSENQCYSVKVNSLEKDHICKLKCTACSSCVHAYSCSCLDFVMCSNMCKHIHKVCMGESSEMAEKDEQQTLQELQKANAQRESPQAIQDEIKKNINSICIMYDWSNVTNRDTLNKVNDHLVSALKLISCDEDSSDANEGMVVDQEELLLPSTNIIILPEPEPEEPQVQVKPLVECSKVEDRRCQEIAETSKILQTYRPIVPRLTTPSLEQVDIFISDFEDIEGCPTEGRKRRPIVLAKSAKRAKWN